MKDKIYNSLNRIVLSDSQKENIYENITKKRCESKGFIIRFCMMTACFIFTFLLFSNSIGIENNKEPRTINYSCNENCEEILED